MSPSSVGALDLTAKANEAAFTYYARLRKLKEFVDSHVSDRISLADAARIAGYEPSYFCAWFHRRAGLKFTEWLTLQRLKKASELIQTQDYDIGYVARATGFSSL